jgi:putative DNA primase/helicase
MFASTLWLNSRLEKAFMLIGSGRNGKSITLMALQDILGYQNISNVSIHNLINNRFSTAKLEGKLLNIYPDIKAREIEESGVLKPIISGERITVENKMEKPHEFTNHAKLIFSANQLPSLNTSSDGDFRRWFVIEFNQKFEGDNQDTKLFEKLTTPEEKSGILNLMIERLETIRDNGRYSHEQSVEEVREIWESKSNSAYRFIQSRLKLDVLGSIPVSKMVEEYEEYCIQNKLAVKPSHSFGLTLKRLFPNVESVQRKNEGINQRVWSGVSL